MNNKVVIGGNTKLNNVISGTPNNVIKVGGTGGGGISAEAKAALLDCFEHVAWIDEDGQIYYQALYDALYAAQVVSLSAVFEQGQAVIYDDDSLNDLKQYLTVTATYDDSTKAVVTDYTLSGTLNPGTSSIGVTYKNKKVYFTVNVTHKPGIVTITNDLNGCTTSNSSTSMTEGDPYTATITANSHYSLTGALVTITMGGVDITSSAYSNGSISIAEVTGSLVISIIAVAVSVSSISAVYTQSGYVYDEDTLDSLRDDLVVTATYSDSSTEVVTNYTLSGTLTAGTSTITVTYEGATTTFTVTVTHLGDYIYYDYLQGDGTAYIDTGLNANTYIGDTYQFYAKFANPVQANEKVVFGARNRWSTTGIIVQSNLASNVFKEQIAYTNAFTLTDVIAIDTIYEIELKDKKVYWNGNVIYTGTGTTPTISNTNQNIGLFCTSTAASGSVVFDQKSPTKIYEFALKDSSGNYIARMIPAKRRSDSVSGMYDVIRDTFYENAGASGSFIAGND